MEPDENRKERLDEKLQMIWESLSSGKVRKIEEYGHQVILEDGTALTIEHIVGIEGELFREYEDLDVQP